MCIGLASQYIAQILSLAQIMSKFTIMIRDCNGGPNPIRAVVKPESPEHAPITTES